ncbi:unnamed protein product [Pleuronectes platessa]|uniref:Uncharacterized protein n=1 Tax=Pleuronectes platessa TaxID=8262 RepID=A0A9N7Y363_PLEPL|nr:unnamed protein product [Pleuronectes platessa]
MAHFARRCPNIRVDPGRETEVIRFTIFMRHRVSTTPEAAASLLNLESPVHPPHVPSATQGLQTCNCHVTSPPPTPAAGVMVDFLTAYRDLLVIWMHTVGHLALCTLMQGHAGGAPSWPRGTWDSPRVELEKAAVERTHACSATLLITGTGLNRQAGGV